MTERKDRGGEPPTRKSLWQQERDREDAYWNPPQAACIRCGDVDDLPKNVEYDEYVCPACAELEEQEAEEFLNHMREITEGKQ